MCSACGEASQGRRQRGAAAGGRRREAGGEGIAQAWWLEGGRQGGHTGAPEELRGDAHDSAPGRADDLARERE